MTFTLREFVMEIELGNEAMRSPSDVAGALRSVAEKFDGHDDFATLAGPIRDVNGNTVGRWYLTASQTATGLGPDFNRPISL
jgi:hypothetical protein